MSWSQKKEARKGMGVKLDGYCEGCTWYKPEKGECFVGGKRIYEARCRYSCICERAYIKGQEDNPAASEIKKASEKVQTNINDVKNEIMKSRLIMILQAVSIICIALAHIFL